MGKESNAMTRGSMNWFLFPCSSNSLVAGGSKSWTPDGWSTKKQFLLFLSPSASIRKRTALRCLNEQTTSDPTSKPDSHRRSTVTVTPHPSAYLSNESYQARPDVCIPPNLLPLLQWLVHIIIYSFAERRTLSNIKSTLRTRLTLYRSDLSIHLHQPHKSDLSVTYLYCIPFFRLPRPRPRPNRSLPKQPDSRPSTQ